VAQDAVPLTGLMEAAPQARHAPAYAAIVVEGGIRRRLWLAGARMVQATEDGDLDAAWQQTACGRRELGACAGRWLALPAHLRRRLPAGKDATAVEAARQQAGTRRARPRSYQAVAAGANALRELAADPSQLTDVSRWLRPEHFARPSDGALYAVMRDMNAAGMPVDPVTVTWEAARRDVRADPARLSGGTGAFATSSAREVYRHGVLAGVARAGRDIQADARHPFCDPSTLMQLAGERLRVVMSERQPGAVAGHAGRVFAPDRAMRARQPSRHPEREASR